MHSHNRLTDHCLPALAGYLALGGRGLQALDVAFNGFEPPGGTMLAGVLKPVFETPMVQEC